MSSDFDVSENVDIAWCPGCGNFSILSVLKNVLTELSVDPHNLVLVSGIGQAAKIPQYFKTHYFNGLHGRALPPATAIKAVNPKLTVIAESGDGDMYGEGGNHFIHTIRRNPDITHIVHNNMVYGLTKGQASPTSQRGFTTPVQVKGVILEPFNPLAVAISLDASFVARTFAGDQKQTQKILSQAINHPGYALVDILQPCVSFNKVNTYQWYKKHTEYISNHDPTTREQAFHLSLQNDPLLLGIFYKNEEKKSFEKLHPVYKNNPQPLIKRDYDSNVVKQIMKLYF
ncbi:MAG: 2-oxoacid ferredoxin oxidoreductase [Candidatus Thermoplasmatota archaeon]|nr:2-oxoacid ferredoxin oxidoreductase [Candidatus Thermoplasmatota archaeon]